MLDVVTDCGWRRCLGKGGKNVLFVHQVHLPLTPASFSALKSANVRKKIYSHFFQFEAYVCVHKIYFDTGASPACDEGPGVCSRLLTVFSLFLIIVSLPLSLFVVVKVVQVISIIGFTFLRSCQSCPWNCLRHLWKSSSSPPSPSWSAPPSSSSVSRPGIVHFIIVFRTRPFRGLHEPTNSLFLENLGSYLQSATLPLSKHCHRDKKKRSKH